MFIVVDGVAGRRFWERSLVQEGREENKQWRGASISTVAAGNHAVSKNSTDQAHFQPFQTAKRGSIFLLLAPLLHNSRAKCLSACV